MEKRVEIDRKFPFGEKFHTLDAWVCQTVIAKQLDWKEKQSKIEFNFSTIHSYYYNRVTTSSRSL